MKSDRIKIVKAVRYVNTGIVYFRYPSSFKYSYLIEDIGCFPQIYGKHSTNLKFWDCGYYRDGIFSMKEDMDNAEPIEENKRWEM